MPMIQIDATKVVIVTDNHGGYLGGQCIACGESGWLADTRYGFPSSKKGQGNKIVHKPECPMNAVLNDDGSFKN